MPIGIVVGVMGRLQLVALPKYWIVHAAFQVTGSALAVAGLLVAWKEIDDLGTGHWHDWHAKLGLSIVVIAGAQILAGMFRPGALCGAKGGIAHEIWSWVHRFGGAAIVIMAAVNIFQGMNLNDVAAAYRILFGVFFGLMVLAYCIALVLGMVRTEPTADSAPGVQMTADAENKPDDEPKLG